MVVTKKLPAALILALALSCTFVGGVTNTGCGGEETVSGMPPSGGGGGGRRRRQSTASTTTAPAGFVTTGILQRRFAEDARDPMMRPFPEEIGSVLEQTSIPIPLPEVPVDRGPLADYSVDQLRLVGIMSRTAQPIAIFSVPDSNRDVFATVDMIVGPNGQGRISDIQPNRVIVSYENLMIPGEPVRTRDIPLRTFPDEFDDVEFVPY